MKHIAEKVRDGVLNLENVSKPVLIQWAQGNENREDRDILGHEIMYRRA